jgi:hypothetical protein
MSEYAGTRLNILSTILLMIADNLGTALQSRYKPKDEMLLGYYTDTSKRPTQAN